MATPQPLIQNSKHGGYGSSATYGTQCHPGRYRLGSSGRRRTGRRLCEDVDAAKENGKDKYTKNTHLKSIVFLLLTPPSSPRVPYRGPSSATPSNSPTINRGSTSKRSQSAITHPSLRTGSDATQPFGSAKLKPPQRSSTNGRPSTLHGPA